jgi:hypothetical protein
MDEEIAADPRYHGSRSEFVYCSVEYALYCVQFEEGVELEGDTTADVPSSPAS